MKKIKKSVQNNALVLLKEREMFFNAFRSAMFKMPWKKSTRESDDLFPREFYKRKST